MVVKVSEFLTDCSAFDDNEASFGNRIIIIIIAIVNKNKHSNDY